jgi:hypothetical protein
VAELIAMANDRRHQTIDGGIGEAKQGAEKLGPLGKPQDRFGFTTVDGLVDLGRTGGKVVSAGASGLPSRVGLLETQDGDAKLGFEHGKDLGLLFPQFRQG